MSTTREKVAALLPLVDRMHRGHHWRKDKAGNMACIKEPLDDFKLAQHCAGREAYGLCPISPGESTCRVALLDLDSHGGETPFDEMVRVAREVMATAALVGLNGVAFRSSGGKGVHVYFAWQEAQDAHSVREMLRSVLTGCGLDEGADGVAAGTAEIFPKQSSVAPDGFGNMFVLALAGKSVLLDDEGNPLPRDAILQLEWPMSDPVPLVARPPKPERPAVDLSAPDIARLRSALAAIPNDGAGLPYDEWLRVVFGVHYATGGSAEGLALIHEFSARSSKYDPDFLDEKVLRYVNDGREGDVVTDRTLYAMATSHGWQDPAIADDFDAVEEDTSGARQAPRLLTAGDLLARQFKPLAWVIPEILPEGVFLLVASPKIGKSWLALQMVLGVANGGEVLGRAASKGSALYLALEDNDRRLQRRLLALDADLTLNDTHAAAVQFSTEWPRVDQGGAQAIADWLVAHPDAKLVVIDVLERFRPARKAKGNLYAEDYEALKALKAVADAHGVTVVVVHHTRKGAADDPMAMVSGTQGLAGAADGMLMLERPRSTARGKLLVIGRDVESDGEFVVEFDQCQWKMVGAAGEVASTLERQEILDALNDAAGPLKAAEVADAVGKKRTTVTRLLTKMVTEGTVTHNGPLYAPAHPHLAVEA